MSRQADKGYSIGDPRRAADLADPARPVLLPCSLERHEYQLEPYLGCGHQCLYCYALCREGGSWDEGVETYEDLTGRLGREIAGLAPQSIYMGLYCDPYQPKEAEKRQTRQALETLAGAGFSASVLTKSDLVARDLDLFAAMPQPSVAISLGFTDDGLRRMLEMNTPGNQSRIQALAAAKARGIMTSVLICPVLPFLTDLEALIESVAQAAKRIWIYPLSIQNQIDPNWRNIWERVNQYRPDLAGEFKAAVFNHDHDHWISLRRLAEKANRKYDAEFIIRI